MCERCGIEQAFANSLPDDPEGRKRIRLHGRGQELAPLRKRFAELAREGLTLEGIKANPVFRDVAYGTMKSWWYRYQRQNRLRSVNPDAPETASVCADAPLGPPAPQSMPPVLAAMLELIPCPDANRQRRVEWLDAWRAVYTLLYLGGQ